jgi:hypothetical protein
LYLLGAKMSATYPMVPLFGNLATGIALFSYAGTLHWGVMADWDLIPDLHDFVLELQKSFTELREAASQAAAGRSATEPSKRRGKPARRAGRNTVGASGASRRFPSRASRG